MPVLGIVASSISGHLVPPFTQQGDYYAIATTTLSGTASSISFAGIPSNFTHLQIRYIAKTNYGSALDGSKVRFNDDSGSNYSWHQLYGGGGGAAASQGGATQTYIYNGYTAGATNADLFGPGIIDILDYTNINKTKTVKTLLGVDFNGGGIVVAGSGNWYSLNAINSLTFTPWDGTSFLANTSFALYGVK